MAMKDKKAVHGKESSTSDVFQKFKANPGLYIGSVLVLVLVTVTFVGGDLISGRRRGASADLTFGYYDNAPISYVPGNVFSQLLSQIEQNYRYQSQLYGYEFDPNDPQMAYYLWQQAFASASVHTAILQEMKRSNYEVPQKMVDKEVAGLPEFQENGRFSRDLYHRMPETRRLAQWQQVRDELAKIVYFNDLYGLLIPSGEADFIANMSSEMRSFEMVSFQVDDYPDSEYLSFARENAGLFSSIHLSRITVNSEREAKRILASVQDGTSTFEDAARTQSQDYYSERGGDMGIRYVFELDQEIPDAQDREKITGLVMGELSDVIQTGERWAFFRVEDQLKPPYFEDDAVMERVKSYMRNYQRGRMEDWAIEKAREFIAEAEYSGFDYMVSRLGKEKRSFGPLPVNYGGVDLFPTLESFSVPELSNSSTNENFWKTAFSTPVNTLSQPIVQGGNVLVLLPTEQIFAEEADVEEIASGYPGWLENTVQHTLQSFFMNNSRMDDHFMDTYRRFFLSGN